MLAKWMHTLSQELELDPPLSEESPGVYYLALDDTLTIRIEEMDMGYAFQCPVAEVQQLPEDLLIELMHGNLFGQGTYGAVLGIDSTGKKIVANMHDPYSTEYDDFRGKLEDFINSIDFWQEEVRSN